MNEESNKFEVVNPTSVERIKEKIRAQCEETINFCSAEKENFYSFEKALMERVAQLGCLFLQLFLMVCHYRLSCKEWLASGLYYCKSPVLRVLKTIYGEVKYWRTYLVKKEGGGGIYPLDTALGLTGDGFTPLVMSLVTKLATRVSFQTSVLIFRCFCRWAPATESVENLVLGLGREASAYMETAAPPLDDGEVLVIECDGKATPTATAEELRKRRGKRKKHCGCHCHCQRHRGKRKRLCCKRQRRKKGDKSKNGRSITIVVMYTLKRGKDGKLHGPQNKIIWASYATRAVMLAWIRRQATKRGFPLESDKQVHIVVDGERCLRNGLAELFPDATFALDIRHLEEKLWDVGRLFHPEGSEELLKWVSEKRTLLYTGQVAALISQLQNLKSALSKRAKRDQGKYQALARLISYMQPRIEMMHYQQLLQEDLPIASGIVEGAARYVIGERMDCSGMRWIPGRAEALLHLRCVELNGEWDTFFQWCYCRWMKKLQLSEKVMVRTTKPIDLTLYSQSRVSSDAA